MSEIEIGRGKRGNRAWAFDDIAIVPSRRTRDPKDVSTTWKIDAYEFGLPVLGAPMDSVVSPETAVAIGKLGGLGVLDLEGLWTRYEDPTKQLAEIAGLLEGRRVAASSALWVFTSRAVKAAAVANGYAATLAAAGARLMTDTCSAISQAVPPGTRVAAFDSAKQAHYLPAMMGIEGWFGTTRDCIDAACTGRWEGRLS